MDKRIFQKVFKIAEVSQLTKEELELLNSDIKAKSDWNGNMSWAKKQGKEEGKLDEKRQIAAKMKEKGLSNKDITELTGLPIDELELLL